MTPHRSPPMAVSEPTITVNASRNTNYPLDVETYYTVLAASLPMVKKNLFLYIPNQNLPTVRHLVPLLRQSRIKRFSSPKTSFPEGTFSP